MPNKKLRLDMALVEKGFFQSRNRAQASIMAGEVLVNGEVDTRADRTVLPEDVITLKEKSCPYVSRGGLKLAGAMKAWNIDVTGKVCVDIGVATGGFSDCMIQAGAKDVYGVDVGKGQLADEMRRYKNFHFKPETNARYMTADLFEQAPQFAAVDVSFISLTMIMEPLFKVMAPEAEIVFLIKPQFESAARHCKNGRKPPTGHQARAGLFRRKPEREIRRHLGRSDRKPHQGNPRQYRIPVACKIK